MWNRKIFPKSLIFTFENEKKKKTNPVRFRSRLGVFKWHVIGDVITNDNPTNPSDSHDNMSTDGPRSSATTAGNSKKPLVDYLNKIHETTDGVDGRNRAPITIHFGSHEFIMNWLDAIVSISTRNATAPIYSWRFWLDSFWAHSIDWTLPWM